MSESSFMMLQQIGDLTLDENSLIKFSIDAYRGYRYASIRKYQTAGEYVGAFPRRHFGKDRPAVHRER